MINLSVVIPVYNDPIGLKKVLKSLIVQDYPKNKYEIIVADNGSTDKTLKVAKAYADKYPELVKYVLEKSIQSSYAARNMGIDVAKGSILAFTDADCIPGKNWLNIGYLKIKNSKASMVAGKIEFTYKDSTPNIWEYYDSAGKLKQRSYVENAGFGATANLFVKKVMFNKYGSFIPEVQSGGDYEFGRRITQAGETLIYDGDALIYHPARTTFKDKLKKSKRIANGQKILEQMNLLEHGKRTWKQLIPTIQYSLLHNYRLNFRRKLLLVVITNFFRYFNYFHRLIF